MRKFIFGAILLILPYLFFACDTLEGGGVGELSLSFADGVYTSTKATFELPDTNDFILTIKDKSGKTIYNGAYGASPETILASSGTYTVTAVSGEFSKPKFDAPQFGDEQTVTVKSGSKVKVTLLCRQMNCGIRLKIDPSFLTVCPAGLLYVKSDQGKLSYLYREQRVAYFKPGSISVILSDGATESTIYTRTLLSQEILTLKISAQSSTSSSSGNGSEGPGGGGSGTEGSGGSGSGGASGGGSVGTQIPSIRIQVDTARNWTSDSYVIGSSQKGNSYDKAYTIAQAKENIGEEDVWICGYIVGGDMTSSATGISFEAPWNSATHIAIGPRSSTNAKSSCMSVQLPSGKIRDELNLHDNPGNKGKLIYIKGDICEAYYGIPGIKNISEYVLK